MLARLCGSTSIILPSRSLTSSVSGTRAGNVNCPAHHSWPGFRVCLPMRNAALQMHFRSCTCCHHMTPHMCLLAYRLATLSSKLKQCVCCGVFSDTHPPGCMVKNLVAQKCNVVQSAPCAARFRALICAAFSPSTASCGSSNCHPQADMTLFFANESLHLD